MRSRMRRNKMMLMAIGGGGALVLLTWISATTFMNASWKSERLKYEETIALHVQDLNVYKEKTRVGYVLRTSKQAGDTLSVEDVEKMALPDYFTPDNLIGTAEHILGKTLKINGRAGMTLTEDMVLEQEELDPSLRREEAQYIRLPLRVSPKDIVDIRIVFPNGEDYIVLSKKTLDDVDSGNQISYFTVSEEERGLLQSALVDAYTNQAELYAIQYVEPQIQPKAVVTYMPNLDVIQVLRANPNIVSQAKLGLYEELRRRLDSRLKKIPEGDRQRIGIQAPDGGAVEIRKETLETLAPQSKMQEEQNVSGVNESTTASTDSGLLGGE